MKIAGIIPARFASTRFPGKPMVEIHGKTMIQRVYEQASKANLDIVVVATDDERIFDHMTQLGAHVVMTHSNHPTGTDRCKEALSIISKNTQQHFHAAINIQGDEPYIHPEQINQLAQAFQDPNTQLATLIKKLKNKEDLENPGIIKVTSRIDSRALYFSRSIIPFPRTISVEDGLKNGIFYKHIGMYGYRTDILDQITQLNQSSSELTESLEQLRWLENGFDIRLIKTELETRSVDTPHDLEILLNETRNNPS